MELTSDNYLVAWKLLVDYYRNERRLLTHHLISLLDLPELTATNLSLFYSKIKENMQALEVLGLKPENYCSLLVVVLLRKFNNYHKRRFEDFRDEKTKMPTVEEICEYLHTEISQFSESEQSVNNKVEFHFNVPMGPHLGGLYEAAVKSFKYRILKGFVV